MTQIFGIPLDILTIILVSITLVIVVGVLLLALTNKIFFKIGVRNIPRRRLQMLLIVFALMLSTTLLSSVLATGDVITAAVQSVAVYNYGNIDEIIEGGRSPIGLYQDGVYYSLLDQNRHNTDILAIGAALREQNLLVADQTSRQVRSKVTALGIIPGSEQGFGGMQDVNSKRHFTTASLKTESNLSQSDIRPVAERPHGRYALPLFVALVRKTLFHAYNGYRAKWWAGRRQPLYIEQCDNLSEYRG